MYVDQVMAVVLSAAMLTGCASRKVYFTSAPFGARVEVGDRRGITPCTIRVPEGVETATFRLTSGEEKILPLPEMDDNLDAVTDTGARVAGGSLMAVGGAVVVLGFLLFMAGSPAADDDEFDYSGEDDDDEWQGDLLGYGLVGMIGGGGVFLLGYWMYPERETPALHADFMLDEE